MLVTASDKKLRILNAVLDLQFSTPAVQGAHDDITVGVHREFIKSKEFLMLPGDLCTCHLLTGSTNELDGESAPRECKSSSALCDLEA